jgi:hypothetical protein
MPVVVDPDPMVVETLLASMPAGSHGVESVDRLNAWISAHSDEYVVVLGPTLTDDEAVVTCEVLRTTAPTISTILAREELTGELLAAAMKCGARDVVHHSDTAAITGALSRAFELFVALRGPAGAMHISKVISVFSPKGGVGKTTIAVNLALALTEKGARRVCLVDLDLRRNRSRSAQRRAAPGTFGPHNLHENRPGSFRSEEIHGGKQCDWSQLGSHSPKAYALPIFVLSFQFAETNGSWRTHRFRAKSRPPLTRAAIFQLAATAPTLQSRHRQQGTVEPLRCGHWRCDDFLVVQIGDRGRRRGQ